MGRVRAYLGMSLDGRIAGPDDELDWLDGPRTRGAATPLPSGADDPLEYAALVADVGCLLLGRRTFDVVLGFSAWPYGDLPVLVATHRPLPAAPGTVRSVAGSIGEVVTEASVAAGGRDVYIDGGRLVCAALDAGLLDELTTTILPTVRGRGIALFDALARPHELDAVWVAVIDDAGAVQVTWLPHPPGVA